MIKTLDEIYARTFNSDDISRNDRETVVRLMKKIIHKCDHNATTKNILRRNMLRKIKRICEDEIEANNANRDVLIHWGIMREMMIQVQTA